jgi:hypothetical protein
VDFDQSRSTDNGNCCSQLDLGLLVINDQESGNRPHALENIRWARRPLYHTQYSSNLHQQLDVGSYSAESQTSIKSSCPLCPAVISVCYASITIVFLAPDLRTEQLNHRDGHPRGLSRSHHLIDGAPGSGDRELFV